MANTGRERRSSSEEDEYYFDALDEQMEEFKVCLPREKKTHQWAISIDLWL